METEAMVITVTPGNQIDPKGRRTPSRWGSTFRAGLLGIGAIVCSLKPVVALAIEAGPGALDVRMTIAYLLDTNINYTSANTEEAVEAQLSPGISYDLPMGDHSLEVGYYGTVIASRNPDADALRQSPFGILSLSFPGGLDISAMDRASLVQNRKQEGNGGLDNPDYLVNQASVDAIYGDPDARMVTAFYRNTAYRYESRAEYRNSDGNELSATAAVPVSARMAILTIGRWANEVSPDLPVRNYRNYNIMGGMRFSGAGRFDLDIAGGYQSFHYYDDPLEEPENSYSLRAALSADVSPDLNLEMTVGSDVRAGVAFSGSAEFYPRTQTSVTAKFSRTAERTFFQDHKYYINSDVEFLIKQQVLRATELYAKLWYAWIDYPRIENTANSNNLGANAREDTRSGWRIGLQYEMGSWVALGLFGEYQRRESNVDVPFSNYKRTVIGVSATIHSPL